MDEEIVKWVTEGYQVGYRIQMLNLGSFWTSPE